jgi:hypothetical protein
MNFIQMRSVQLGMALTVLAGGVGIESRAFAEGARRAAAQKTRYSCVLAAVSDSGTYGLEAEGPVTLTLTGKGKRQQLTVEYVQEHAPNDGVIVDGGPVDLTYKPRSRIGWKRFDGETGRDCALYYYVDGALARGGAAGVFRAECTGPDHFSEKYFCRRQ